MSAGCTLLLLEDEPLILMDLEFAAEDLDCKALCATDVAEAMEHIEGDTAIHAAILDVTLRGGETCEPVARALEKRGIPYILHSGDLNRQDELVRNLGVKHIPKPADPDFVIKEAIDAISAPQMQGD